MTHPTRSYPSKLLLFGEYSLLIGSSALSIPFPGFSGKFCLPGDSEEAASHRFAASNRHLRIFFEYLITRKEQFDPVLDLDKFSKELEMGLCFVSDIPSGYGLGSSGALVAAVFERYSGPDWKIPESKPGLADLKTILSGMESCFHGKSSGFDPLVSLLQKPLLLQPGGGILFPDIPENSEKEKSGFFLIDTGGSSKTAPLVNYFLQKFKPEHHTTPEGESLVRLVNEVTRLFLEERGTGFRERMMELSLRQMEEFRPMIPEKFLPVWRSGIEKGLYYNKLCGSGGGGYLLAYSTDLPEAISFLGERSVRTCSLSI